VTKIVACPTLLSSGAWRDVAISYGKARELLDLALFLAGRTGATLAEIEARFECGRRRAQRMIAALGDLLPQLERAVDEERRPRWRLPVSLVTPFLAPSSDELAALAKAPEILERDGAVGEATSLRQLDAKVRAAIPSAVRTRLAVDEEALLESLGLVARPGPRPATNTEIDEIIGHALKARRCLRIHYASHGQVEPRWRRIEPYGLLLGTRRYLVALNAGRKGAYRHFRVDAIVAAELDEAYFTPDPAFDLTAHAKRGFSSYERADEYGEVVWRFSPEAAPHAGQYQFHPDQILEPQDDGTLIVRFVASGHLEMAWHLYMWGDQVEVIQPTTLKTMTEGYRRSDFPALP